MMATKTKKGQQPKVKETTFKCKFCGESKPLEEIVVLTRFFPPLIVCRDCEKIG